MKKGNCKEKTRILVRDKKKSIMKDTLDYLKEVVKELKVDKKVA